MNLIERFPRYTPSDSFVSMMEDGQVLSTKVDRELRYMDLTVRFSEIVRKEKLYRFIDEVKKAYALNRLNIVTKYDAALFSSDYIEDVILETYERGAVSKGFFSDYTLDFSLDKIIIKVPFIQGGIDLLEDGHTNKVISDIIKDEFGINVKVCIQQRDDYEKVHAEYEKSKMNALKQALELQKKVIQKSTKEEKEESLKEMRSEYKKSMSFNADETVKTQVIDNKIKVGAITFDISSREYVTGGIFDIDNIVPISRVENGMHGIVVLGKVFEISEKPIKRGASVAIQIGITDNISSIYIKDIVSASEGRNFIFVQKRRIIRGKVYCKNRYF